MTTSDDVPTTVDLAAVLDQAQALHGAARPTVAGTDLAVPGWLLGAWAIDAGALVERPEGAADTSRLLWLADSGHLLWLPVAGGAVDRAGVLVADTPRSFLGSVCDDPDDGPAVWTRAVMQVPLLAACPLGFDAWDADRPRPVDAGGPTLLAVEDDRALDLALADEIRRATDPRTGRAEQTWCSWATDSARYRVPGVFATTATERAFPPGSIIPTDAIRHFLFVSTRGTWLAYTSNPDDTSTIREYDTVRDLYRFQITGRPPGDVFAAMWNNLTARHPRAREAERPGLDRWLAR